MLVLISLAVFAYFTTWIFFVPFVSKKAALRSYFLPEFYAAFVPAVCLLFAVFVIAGLAVMGSLQSSSKTRTSKKKD